MATYTQNYNLKMPSGQDAPDVEDFNGNAEIIDKALDAHANNFADKYDPDSTYTQGKLCIQNDALWKAKQNIDTPEPWTESHWESTTLAAELAAQASDISSLNSRTPTLKRANIEAEFASGVAAIPFSSIGIDTAPDFAMVQSLYSSSLGTHADSFTVQIALSTINVYGRTENDQQISGNRRLGIFMWFDS